jgi:IPT/TIG domain/Dockerin type I domain
MSLLRRIFTVMRASLKPEVRNFAVAPVEQLPDRMSAPSFGGRSWFILCRVVAASSRGATCGPTDCDLRRQDSVAVISRPPLLAILGLRKRDNRNARRTAGLRGSAPRRTTLGVEGLEDRRLLTLLGQQIFPADNPWNQNIASAPVAANSAAIIAKIGSSIRLHPDWGADSAANGNDPLYGIPVNIVHGNTTAKVNVSIDNYPDESDIVPVPIPANAVLEGDFQNGPNPNGGGYGENGNPNQRGDSHLIIWDEDDNIAYELYGVSRPNDPTLFPNNDDVEVTKTDNAWHAAQETVWNMNTDTFRTLGATSADAAGLSILAGLARPDEGLPTSEGGQGAINHALRVTLPGSDVNPQYIYPASHEVNESQGSNKLPLGGRLRLENTPAINTLISNMPPESQIVARAMQQYGLIVADIGSAMYVTGTSASENASGQISQTWNLDDIFASNGLEVLTAGDFQVVDLTPKVTSLSASSGAAGSTITITGQNFSGAAGHLSVLFGTTPASSITIVSDSQITAVVPQGSGTVPVTVQSGVTETDQISDNPNANAKAPIFGYGVSATSSSDLFTFTTSGLPGDANHDGVVNGLDIQTVASHWLTSGPAGDVNNDGLVNGLDIQLIASHWLATAGGAAGSMVTPDDSTSATTLSALVVTSLKVPVRSIELPSADNGHQIFTGSGPMSVSDRFSATRGTEFRIKDESDSAAQAPEFATFVSPGESVSQRSRAVGPFIRPL